VSEGAFPLCERFDPSSTADAFLVAIHEVRHEGHVGRRDGPCCSASESITWLRHPPSGDRRWIWAVRSGEGVAAIGVVDWLESRSTAAVELVVRRECRRYRLGAALLDAVAAEARTNGVRRLVGRYASEEGEAFARFVGAEPGQRVLHQVLHLADLCVHRSPGEDLKANYRLRSWVGATPERLLLSFARVRNAINDAPHDSGLVEHWTPDRIRDMEEAVARRGRQIRVSAAVSRLGDVVGFTEIRVSHAPGGFASTEDTAILRDHRGSRLASWLKEASLTELRGARPDITQIATQNAESNAGILKINERLGFRPVAVWTDAAIDLDKARAPLYGR